MKRFQTITEDGQAKVRVVASTRAGFMTAALEGMFALAIPQFVETDPDSRFVANESEREFKVKSDDFPALLANFLNEALRQAQAGNESFIGVRLTLITDKQAEGAFLGQPVTGWGRPLKSALEAGLRVEKNQLGYWESTVEFSV